MRKDGHGGEVHFRQKRNQMKCLAVKEVNEELCLRSDAQRGGEKGIRTQNTVRIKRAFKVVPARNSSASKNAGRDLRKDGKGSRSRAPENCAYWPLAADTGPAARWEKKTAIFFDVRHLRLTMRLSEKTEEMRDLMGREKCQSSR